MLTELLPQLERCFFDLPCAEFGLEMVRERDLTRLILYASAGLLERTSRTNLPKLISTGWRVTYHYQYSTRVEILKTLEIQCAPSFFEINVSVDQSWGKEEVERKERMQGMYL